MCIFVTSIHKRERERANQRKQERVKERSMKDRNEELRQTKNSDRKKGIKTDKHRCITKTQRNLEKKKNVTKPEERSK